jgi:hypothetical protein
MSTANASCFTPPLFVANSVGEVCAGHGSCIDGVCVCDYLWTGLADNFPLNSCMMPVVVDKLFWAICAFALLALLFRTRNVFAHQIRLYFSKRNESKRTGKRTGNNDMFYSFLLCYVVAVPGLAATAIARVATDFHFGVDLPMSLAYGGFFSLYMIGVAVVDHQLFKITMFGAKGFSGTAKQIIRRNKHTKVASLVVYCVTVVGAQVGMCFSPLGVNPQRIGLLVLQTTASTLYFATYYAAHATIVSQLETIVSSESIGGKEEKHALNKIKEDTRSPKSP